MPLTGPSRECATLQCHLLFGNAKRSRETHSARWSDCPRCALRPRGCMRPQVPRPLASPSSLKGGNHRHLYTQGPCELALNRRLRVGASSSRQFWPSVLIRNRSEKIMTPQCLLLLNCFGMRASPQNHRTNHTQTL